MGKLMETRNTLMDTQMGTPMGTPTATRMVMPQEREMGTQMDIFETENRYRRADTRVDTNDG